MLQFHKIFSFFSLLTKKVSNYLLHFVTLQLYLTLISLPLFLYHGLPFSLLTFLGNLFFTPVLICYLFGASIFMIVGLIGFCPLVITILLNSLTHFWLLILSYSPKICLIACKKPPLFFLACGTIILYFLLVKVIPGKPLLEKLYLLLILNFLSVAILAGYNLLTKQPQHILQINNKKYSFTIDSTGKTYLFEHGNFDRLRNPLTARYQLVQEFIKKIGITSLDFLVIDKVSKRVCKVIKQFNSIVPIHTLIISPKTKFNSLQLIKKFCKKNSILLSNEKKEFSYIS